jgi:ubiquinone/menaquinone biosynthesis C-methylase UbiE
MARIAPLIPTPLRPAYDGLRRIVRRFASAEMAAPLRTADAAAVLHALSPAVVADRGTPFKYAVRVINRGQAVWSSQGAFPVQLRGRWLTSRQRPTPLDDVFIPLPRPLAPGESLDVTTTGTAPDAVGQYLLAIAPEQAGGPAFHITPKSALIDVQVTAPAIEEIDYHKAYATANLDEDYWTVVGPPTEAEFHRLAHAKRQQLIEQGLTPNSWVLDVGCGTGQLAVGLVDYLSDKGGLVGTDVGPEAIAYCRRKYARPNFQFHVNDFTTLPPMEHRFDMACFFSVFTHTYPDETLLLLAETTKLMKPTGVILGDVFTSPLTDRCAGNRGAVEVNREHFLRIVDLVGLKVEVAASWNWKHHARREVLRFTQR